jgi:hypothetical protein
VADSPKPKSLAEVAHERLMLLSALQSAVTPPKVWHPEEDLPSAVSLQWQQQLKKLELWADETQRLLSTYGQAYAGRFAISVMAFRRINALAEFMRRHAHYHMELVAMQETPECAAKFPLPPKAAGAPQPTPSSTSVGIFAWLDSLNSEGKWKLGGAFVAVAVAAFSFGNIVAGAKADRDAAATTLALHDCKAELARHAEPPKLGPAPAKP